MNEAGTYLERRQPRAQFVSARGLRHHVMSWGEPALVSPTCPALVMVHGYMDVGASFQFLIDALERLEGPRRYALALDLRGFGLTEAPNTDAYWFLDNLADLEAVLDRLLPGQPIDLLGHSMGGNVVMTYAGARPERIRRLINLEGFGLPETRPDEAPARVATWLDQLQQPQTLPSFADHAGVARRLIKNNPRLAPERAAWLARHWARGEPGALQVLGDPAHKRVNPILYRVSEALAFWSRIQAKVLFVEGTETEPQRWWGTRYTLAEFHQRLSVVPDVQRAQLRDAGHMLHHDQPDALAALIAPFLQA
jgi:pimeloyl-ACP methyl ester carboxylesterase